MTSAEAHAIGTHAGEFAGGAAERIGELHTTIAERPFAALGVVGVPVHAVHDAVAQVVYTAVGATLRGAGRVGGTAAGLLATSREPLDASVVGRRTVAVLNASFGDRLQAADSPLALPMAVRAADADVAIDPDALLAAFPGATRRVAVLVHGLGETEHSWAGEQGYVGQIAALGLTPVLLRYNSGRRISDNGRLLEALLGELVARWPDRIDELVLVGHSMGGLIIRSAIHHGTEPAAEWTHAVSRVVCLGSPHDGAPLERFAHRSFELFARLPEGRPIRTIANLRSAGIKDLRHGSLLEEHWVHDDHRGGDVVKDVAMLPDAKLFCASASLAADPDSLPARIIGDLLVTHASAHGAGPTKHRTPLRVDGSRHFPGMRHFDLLHHPEVGEQLIAWLQD